MLKIKSLLPSLYKREEFPLFKKEGLGEIFTTIFLFNYGLLGNLKHEPGPLKGVKRSFSFTPLLIDDISKI
jgi:hypothetical protein